MTLEIDGVDIIALVEIGAVVGGIVSMLLFGLLVYLLVRPPRHVRAARRRPVEQKENEAEALLDLMDRMESRLGVLERALVDQTTAAATREHQPVLAMADNDHEIGRMK